MTTLTQTPENSTATLYVVATPIGNLEDLTPRAARVLREVAVVAAEDTRRTATLLRHVGSGASMLVADEHHEQRAAQKIAQHLAAGESVALVSDAGTPAISDPGGRVVAAIACRRLARGRRARRVCGGSSVVDCRFDACGRRLDFCRIFADENAGAITHARRLEIAGGGGSGPGFL